MVVGIRAAVRKELPRSTSGSARSVALPSACAGADPSSAIPVPLLSVATTRVPISEFERGSLPMVDFSTGEPADGRVELSASPRRGLAPLLILLGVIPYLIWVSTRAKPVFGSLPMTRASLDGLRRFDARTTKNNRLALVMLIIGILGIIAGSRGSSASTAIGAVFIGGALLLWIVTAARPYPIRVDLDPSGRSVVLDAHPEFARQLALSLRTPSERTAITSVADELERLGELRASGVIDDLEFKAAKHKLLD